MQPLLQLVGCLTPAVAQAQVAPSPTPSFTVRQVSKQAQALPVSRCLMKKNAETPAIKQARSCSCSSAQCQAEEAAEK